MEATAVYDKCFQCCLSAQDSMSVSTKSIETQLWTVLPRFHRVFKESASLRLLVVKGLYTEVKVDLNNKMFQRIKQRHKVMGTCALKTHQFVTRYSHWSQMVTELSTMDSQPQIFHLISY